VIDLCQIGEIFVFGMELVSSIQFYSGTFLGFHSCAFEVSILLRCGIMSLAGGASHFETA
jgi:hypothetical protein